MRRRRTSAEIDVAAADWAARLDRSALDPDENERLRRWLAEDVRHVGALARAQAMLERIDVAVALGDDFTTEQSEQTPSRRHFLQASAAAVAAAALGSWLILDRSPGTYVTAKGEVRLLPLEDGTVVTLNTDSRLEVLFERTRRLVRLRHGEALFEVARDSTRPFIVEAGSARVQAIGTAFTVRNMVRKPVIVAVQEGVVEVTSRSRSFSPLRLEANMRAVAEEDREGIATSSIDPADTEGELAWREGKIAFHGETLEQAAIEFARYSTMRIVLEGHDLSQRKVTGYFSATDVPGFARAVATSLNLRLQIGDAEVVLSDAGG